MPPDTGSTDTISGEAVYNRTLEGALAKVPYAYYEARTKVFRKNGARTAYTFRDKKLIPIMYVNKMIEAGPAKDFSRFATAWELKHSKVPFGDGQGNVHPLVDENMVVVGHYGSFDSSEVFVPRDLPDDGKVEEVRHGSRLLVNKNLNVYVPGQNFVQTSKSSLTLKDMLQAEIPVFASKYDTASYRNRGYMEYPRPQMSFTVLTDIEGQILLEVDSRDKDGITPSTFSPLDLISVAKLVLLGAATVAGALTVRTLIRRRAAKALQQSAKRELGAGAGGEAAKDAAKQATQESVAKVIRGNPPAVNIGSFGEAGNLIARVDIVEGKVIYRVSAIVLKGEGSGIATARAAHREMIRRAAQQAQKNGQKQFTFRGIDANANFREHADKLAREIGLPGSGKVIAGSAPGFTSYEVTLDAAKALK